MKDRKPYDLAIFIRCYNIFQIIVCFYFVKFGYERGFALRDALKCLRERTDEKEMLWLWTTNWYFLLLRLVELSETIVFVLRKKQRQVSTLHLYHHISTVSVLWLFQKYGMNEMGIYAASVNSMVHVLMYSYYLLSSFKCFSGPSRFIKPFITIIQLIQLVAIFGNALTAISCNKTKLYYLQIVNILILIGFFAKFYADNFVKTNKKAI